MAGGGLSKAFQSSLARPVLNRLATIPVFQQGQELFLHQQTKGLVAAEDGASATVHDGEPFLARLWMEDGFLQYECGCERGQQGLMCAHAVAVALAALERKTAAGKTKKKAETINLAETDRILREQSSDTLTGLLLTWAQQDDRLLQHLMNFAAQQGGFALDLKTYRSALKRRLKKPSMHATPAESKRHAKAVSLELDQLEALLTQGQAFAALELSAEIVMLLLKFEEYSAAFALVRDQVPRAYSIFLRAAKQTKAEAKTLIPHQIGFHRLGLDPELKQSNPKLLAEFAELLGKQGQLDLARAAEALVDPKAVTWEGRVASRRMLELAQTLYLSAQDFEALERLLFGSGAEDAREILAFARQLLRQGEPERARGFLERAKGHFKRSPPRESYWLLSEAQVQLGDVSAAFVSLLPVLEQHDAQDFEAVHRFAVDHGCWPQWREYLLAEKPPGRPAVAHRPHWRFQLHMLEKNYTDAWALAVWHQLDPVLSGQCALEMRELDPVHAARVLAASAEAMMKDDRTIVRALGYLDAAAQLVVDHQVRPDHLGDLLRATHRRFNIYGMAHLVKTREPLWQKAIGMLSAQKLSLVPSRRA